MLTFSDLLEHYKRNKAGGFLHQPH